MIRIYTDNGYKISNLYLNCIDVIEFIHYNILNMSIRITCIKKDGGNHENPYVAISSLTWINEKDNSKGTNSRVEIHDWIKGGGNAYVKDGNGKIANLIAKVSAKGTKYVQTEADSAVSDNLLKLPECR